MSETEGHTVIDLTEAAAGPTASAAGGLVSTDTPVIVDEADGDADDALPKRAVENDDGSITLPLLRAVVLTWRKGTVDTEERIESVTLRRLNGKDVRMIMSAARDAFALKLTAASVAAQYSPTQWSAIYDRMDGADAMDVFLVAQRFLSSGPKTPGR